MTDSEDTEWKMRERPIIFSAAMIKALLAGTKSQSRRIVKPRPREMQPLDFPYELELTERNGDITAYTTEQFAERCPYGVVGDRLWVREAWSHDAPDLDACRSAHEDALPGTSYGPYYRATEVSPDTLKWITPIHMPRWASRITLEITEVRVQRVQEISEADILAEGVTVPFASKVTGTPWTDIPDLLTAWRLLWDHINGDRATWSSNPWCWCLSFKRVEQP